ncbi:hypothetical protein NC653_026299 [Populus alba x Populus x berolinensis]|uniref:Uncharacterized protein n=1 Tax=Populus alba x Populus x berolinensis TaxID=444605 RepID=A0AAD6ME57_9ROSI|nr:hypothetical protein NC653_026299 [Populus alba x Populus x berolinensis]
MVSWGGFESLRASHNQSIMALHVKNLPTRYALTRHLLALRNINEVKKIQ